MGSGRGVLLVNDILAVGPGYMHWGCHHKLGSWYGEGRGGIGEVKGVGTQVS